MNIENNGESQRQLNGDKDQSNKESSRPENKEPAAIVTPQKEEELEKPDQDQQKIKVSDEDAPEPIQEENNLKSDSPNKNNIVKI